MLGVKSFHFGFYVRLKRSMENVSIKLGDATFGTRFRFHQGTKMCNKEFLLDSGRHIYSGG
jgi:hypothetical protein